MTSVFITAEQQTVVGISGYVLAPDGVPVTAGGVMIQAGLRRVTATLDHNGRFHVVPETSGPHQLVVNAPDLAAYRLDVNVPRSRTLALPVIRLAMPTYFRAHFVTSTGEPVTAPRLQRQTLDSEGRPVVEFSLMPPSRNVGSDGTITIGPLPRGRTLFALDTPPLARMRLPDVIVDGNETLFDGGTVVVDAGAVLHVEVVDGAGIPVPHHDVFLEDVRTPSPLPASAARTDQHGMVRFDRLGQGRYRLRTWAIERCGGRPLSLARVVSVGGSAALQTRLIVGGTAAFRVASSYGPLGGVTISAAPDVGLSTSSPPAPPSSPRPRTMGSSSTAETYCSAMSGADGHASLNNFPPGPARLTVGLANSTYVRRITVPERTAALAVHIAEGVLPVRISNALTRQPVARAAISWEGGGVRIEALSSGNGEALLEGVASTAGTLMVAAEGYLPDQTKLPEPPASLHEVFLTPAPSPDVRARVSASSGEPIGQAAVVLASRDPLIAAQLTVTDPDGIVTFSDVPRGELRIIATADGFVRSVIQVPEESRDAVVLALAPGYRVRADVELPDRGPYEVRVFDQAGTSVDDLLDHASPRRIGGPGQLSLGPLPPGNYVIELQGPREQRQHPVRIVDRDVAVIIR